MAVKVLTTNSLEFERGHPSDFRDRFASDIQPARHDYYRKVFDRRSPAQVRRFVSRLTLENWSDPNASVGTVARDGQRRMDPVVVLATDLHTKKVKGHWYATRNVSSKAERVLNRLHVPTKITAPIGEWERQKKIELGREYVWTSECPHDSKVPGLSSMLGALALPVFDPDLAGTWFPYDEEQKLKDELLTPWGYAWNGEEPYSIDGPKNFGPGAPDTHHELWVAPRVGDAVETMNEMAIRGE